MRMRPMDKRALIHKIKWHPGKFLDSKEAVEIDKVRLVPMVYFFPLNIQQTNLGNWRLYYCPVQSTVDGVAGGPIPKFAVGDTIEFLSAPEYPKTTTILTVTPEWDLDGKSIHHLEIMLR